MGKIVECEPHPSSTYLYKEKVDVGEGVLRDIGSGLQGKISIEELKSDLVLVFANLKPRKLADFMSDGMIMCASDKNHETFELIRPPPGSKVGDRV